MPHAPGRSRPDFLEGKGSSLPGLPLGPLAPREASRHAPGALRVQAARACEARARLFVRRMRSKARMSLAW